MRVCVLGGGIVGTTTAFHLSDRLGDAASVCLMAKEFSPDTNSDGVAGWLEPHLDQHTPRKNIK